MKFLKILFSRFVINSILILAQIFFIINFFLKLSDYVYYVYIGFLVVSYLIVLYLLNKNTNPSLKIPWIVFILLMPIPGVIAYIMFGRQYYPKYLRKKNKKIKEQIKPYLLKEDTNCQQMKYIEKASGLGVTVNNHVDYFDSGESMYESMLEDIKNAKKYVFLEFFILSKGKMLDELIDLFVQKTKENVEIRIIYDDIGSIKHLPFDFDKKLRKLNIKCVKFLPYVPVVSSIHNNRDHRKFVIIDGVIGYTGGINIADEYINLINPLGHWKDSGIKIVGDGVKNMLALFLTTWNTHYKEQDQDFCRFFTTENTMMENNQLQVFGDGPKPLYHDTISENVIINIINQAQHKLYITTPYLIVDYDLMNALKLASKRGVDVRIITPHIPDKKIVFMMTQASYKELITTGCKIYEYLPGFIHSKVILSDDEIALIGSVNLDYRSLIHHFESATYLYKLDIYQKMEKDFLETINKSLEITNKNLKKGNWLKRLIVSILQFFAPLL